MVVRRRIPDAILGVLMVARPPRRPGAPGSSRSGVPDRKELRTEEESKKHARVRSRARNQVPSAYKTVFHGRLRLSAGVRRETLRRFETAAMWRF